MIKIYGMQSCPDCVYVEQQIKGNSNFELIDIGENVKNLREFLQLRDSNAIFDAVKQKGSVGIPCFLLEDGTVSLTPESVGLNSKKDTFECNIGQTCGLDGRGC